MNSVIPINSTPGVREASQALNESLNGIVVPRPGLYPKVDFADYLRWNCASSSRLAELERSPAHLKASIDFPDEPTDAQEIGTAGHCAILEPDDFTARYARGPEGNWSLKAQKDQVAELRASGFLVLKPDVWAACYAMRDAIYAHPAAKLALGGKLQRELSGVWEETRTHVPAKLRIDHLNAALGATVEIKTALDAADMAFEKAIYNYRYYRQAAWYLEGMGVLMPDVPWKHHIIIAVEKEPPFAVNVFRLRDDAVQAGRDEIFGTDERPGLIHKYAECLSNNQWPAYGHAFKEISLPPWAWKQIDERTGRAS